MKREDALARRRFSLDLVPEDCYWRPLSPCEQRIDFSAVEEADGKALHGSRLRLGVLLAAQRNAVILRTRSPRFSPRMARVTPSFMGRQIAREFIRIHARGYSDGMRLFGNGDTLKTLATDRLMAEAKAAGYAFVDKVMAPVRRSIVDTYALTGRRVKPQPTLEAEIRTAYAKYLEPAPAGTKPVEIRMATPLGIEYATWEQRNSPISAYLDVLFREFEDTEAGLPQMTASATTAEISTERQRLLNAGIYESGLQDEATEAFQFSAIMDGATCRSCRSLDGVVRPKDDFEFWGFYTPPIHPRCRCSLISVTQRDAQKVTEKGVVDDLLGSVFGKMPPGFGGYDPSFQFGRATR